MAGLKGFKRWIALGLVALAMVMALGAFVFRVDILRTSLDPKVPFLAYSPPRAPDYAEARAWVLPIDPRPPAALPADVFFIHPTTYDGGRHWNAPFRDQEGARLLDRVMLPNYAGPFARVGRIFAPRYRQASLYSQLTLREDARAARAFAYGDVRRAFRYWRAHHDTGRPLVLVGVEQGGLLAERLLREEIAPDPALSARLAGAYLIETVAPASSYDGAASVPACSRRDQARCVVAWATPRDGDRRRARDRALIWDPSGVLVELQGRAVLCVNPLTGARGDARADERLSLGAANATGMGWGVRPPLLKREVHTRCIDGFLDVSRPTSTAFRPARGWADRLKVAPYNLFYRDLEVDAQARVSALLGRQAYGRPAPPISRSIPVQTSPVHRID
ncbi:MAG TPA: DUF3089 domain-containing protein [Caulobacter sp.]|nr:DUF3089 domain-containing protein [Caulobacter sp.]